MSDNSENYVDINISEWKIVQKSEINEPKLIALVENASLEATSADGNKRTVHFKKGAVIEVAIDSRGGSTVWDPVDVLTDTSTR